MNRYLISVHSEYLTGKLKCVFITVMRNKKFLRKQKNLTHKHKNNGREKKVGFFEFIYLIAVAAILQLFFFLKSFHCFL